MENRHVIGPTTSCSSIESGSSYSTGYDGSNTNNGNPMTVRTNPNDNNNNSSHTCSNNSQQRRKPDEERQDATAGRGVKLGKNRSVDPTTGKVVLNYDAVRRELRQRAAAQRSRRRDGYLEASRNNNTFNNNNTGLGTSNFSSNAGECANNANNIGFGEWNNTFAAVPISSPPAKLTNMTATASATTSTTNFSTAATFCASQSSAPPSPSPSHPSVQSAPSAAATAGMSEHQLLLSDIYAEMGCGEAPDFSDPKILELLAEIEEDMEDELRDQQQQQLREVEAEEEQDEYLLAMYEECYESTQHEFEEYA